jgi:hypothetical protein
MSTTNVPATQSDSGGPVSDDDLLQVFYTCNTATCGTAAILIL